MFVLHSIRGRFLRLNLITVLLCVVLVGGLGLWSISVIQGETSQEILSLTCRSEGQLLDNALTSIENSVDLFCTMTDGQLPSLDSLRDPQFLADFYELTEQSMGQIAHVTQGVCAYYFRTAPELTEKPEGFFYGKRPGSHDIVKEPLTDLSLYAPTDTEHVGWYYQPQRAGHSIWMEPYYNRNLGVYMISYVVPLYRNGVFWGLAGMDIDFNLVISHVRQISPYSTGYAFLCSKSGMIYYHPDFELGTVLTEQVEELSSLPDAFEWETASEVHPGFTYHYGGVGKTLTFYRLLNGMELVLTVQNSEIKAPMVALFQKTTAVAFLMCAAVALLIIPIANRITRPLDQLTKAARMIALGNMKVKLPNPGNDEVGVLTRAFSVTVSSLKQHLDSINNMAFTDPLTHVKNKTAYNRAILSLQGDMDGGLTAFGMVMFDLNNLKLINDRYGHERGDEYIIGCCRLICRVFKHCPVYRVGGDEFIAVLSGDSLTHCEELIAELNAEIRASMSAPNPWQRLSIAKGAAFCSPSDATPESVFARADRAMYDDKHQMKNSPQKITS